MLNTANNQRPVVEQTTNNATSWVGHHPGQNKEVVTGQTFIAPSNGMIDTIEVYSSIVTQPGKVLMTIHSFDKEQNKWGPALANVTKELAFGDTGKWISFAVPSIQLEKDKSYGFKLESPDSFIGVGEAAGSAKQPPFTAGQEWRFTATNKGGDSFSYFSLAFKVGLRA